MSNEIDTRTAYVTAHDTIIGVWSRRPSCGIQGAARARYTKHRLLYLGVRCGGRSTRRLLRCQPNAGAAGRDAHGHVRPAGQQHPGRADCSAARDAGERVW